jgi:hypothetical protein
VEAPSFRFALCVWKLFWFFFFFLREVSFSNEKGKSSITTMATSKAKKRAMVLYEQRSDIRKPVDYVR